jgi:hypothetical protein
LKKRTSSKLKSKGNQSKSKRVPVLFEGRGWFAFLYAAHTDSPPLSIQRERERERARKEKEREQTKRERERERRREIEFEGEG